MSLTYSPQELRDAVEKMFAHLALTHPNPEISGVEQSIVCAKVHEHTTLEEAIADSLENSDHVKPRVVIVSHATNAANGAPIFSVRKGRENKDKSIQIGRTWQLESLTSLDVPPDQPHVLIIGFKKPYYWVFGSPELRSEFEKVLKDLFFRTYNQRVPELLAPPEVPSVSRKRTVMKQNRPPQGAPNQGPPQHIPVNQASPHQAFVNQVPPHQISSHQAPMQQQGAHQAPASSPQANANSQFTASQSPQGMYSRDQYFAQEGSFHSQQQAPPGTQLYPTGLDAIASHHPHPQQQYHSQPPRSVPANYSSPPAPLNYQNAYSASQQHQPVDPGYKAQYPGQPAFEEQSSAPIPPRHGSVRSQRSIPAEPLGSENSAPYPPPHSSGSVSETSLDQVNSVAPLRSAQKSSGPTVPQRAPTRSSRSHDLRSRQRSHGHGTTPSRGSSNSHLVDQDETEMFGAPSGVPQQQPHQPLAATQPGSSGVPSTTSGQQPRGEVQQQSQNGNEPRKLQPAASFSSLQPAGNPERRGTPTYGDSRNSQFSPIKSPTGASAYQHRRSLSSTPLALSSKTENKQLRDLASVIDELKWDGMDVTSLERSIKERLDQVSYQHFSGVVNLDTQLDDINVFVKRSIDECNRLDAKMQAVAMNLVGKGDDMTHIEGRGDGLQVLALNYRKLAREIEKLLEVSRLDDEFVATLYDVEFGDPQSPNTPMRLRQIENMLVDLNQALEMFNHRANSNVDGSALTMQAFQEPKRTAQELAMHIGSRFQNFIGMQFTSLLKNSPAINAPFNESLEYRLFTTLYNYSGCLLFIRDNVPSTHQQILRDYERSVNKVYHTEFGKSLRQWNGSIEQIVGKERKSNPEEGPQSTLTYQVGSNGTNQPQLQKLSTATVQQTYQLFTNMVDNLCRRIAGQQCFLEKFFHLGSDENDKFTAFATQESLPDRRKRHTLEIINELERMTYTSIDASKSATQVVLNIMQCHVFPQLGDVLAQSIARISNIAPFESIYLTLVLDIRSYELRRTNQQFLAALLGKAHQQMADAWEEISRTMTRLILGSHFTTKKRVGVHPVVVMFTEHVSIIETSISAALNNEITRRKQLAAFGKNPYEGDATRQIVDRGHANMFRAIAQGLRMGAASSEIQSGGVSAAARLKAAARETTGSGGGPNEEAKELLNRHVVMIENLYRIYTDLGKFGSVGVQSIVIDARQHYQRELEGYIADVISRPIGKIVAFVNQHEARSTHQAKHKDNVSALKRVIKGYDVRELRNGIDHLRKRVEKHFAGSDPAVLNSVWRAIYNEVVNYYNRVTRIAQSLDAMNYVEFQVSDITSAFNL